MLFFIALVPLVIWSLKAAHGPLQTLLAVVPIPLMFVLPAFCSAFVPEPYGIAATLGANLAVCYLALRIGDVFRKQAMRRVLAESEV